ncbi:amino acid ABC transporter permease [Marasmitruncus massiliensis]|jgi:His/Glu/Gln/Arg/opine family amino acid ABC transporter permease subunit|uniref:amino acid ABC transporter permease n=1 Tax=Marasmitruncus massiliensis TaxID=1944642 RepID=UPI000C7B9F6E|nr:amino acid ABC transporter permease [Marasmitruncus massiliensis]MBE6906791.1 amino acid ABC transporter permease [Oscillospiraceae bacterium]
MAAFLQQHYNNLYIALLAEDRWKQYVEGLGRTLLIAACATLIGILIGMIIAVVKVSAAGNRKLRFLEILCDLYLTVIRGTPVVVQLLILYTAVFTSMTNGTPVAIIGFGLNSGAYVAEIFRSGIMSIPHGQTEAGRSLGLTSWMTMRLIVLPQAVKNILPALFNEFITLLKETSVAGMIAVRDLTKVADGIKGRAFISEPLFVAALIYLVLVIAMTQVQKRLERRLGKGDRR